MTGVLVKVGVNLYLLEVLGREEAFEAAAELMQQVETADLLEQGLPMVVLELLDR